MMNGRINQSTASLQDTRRRVLAELIEERYKDDSIPKEFIEQQIQFYLEKMEDGIPVLTPRPQKDLTDAHKINDELSEYEIDIHAAYAQLEHVGSQIKQHQKLNESILNDVKLKIRRADNKLEEYRQLMMNQSAHQIFFETFLDQNNREKDERFYTDRDGKQVSNEHHLKVDINQHALKLPTINVENCLVNFAGVKLANIEITKQIGEGFIRSRNPEHGIEKAIDTSNETFWSESILTDEPLQVNLGLDYYGVDFGATCELEITFDYITRINEITLTPFSEYPLEVVAIHAYANDIADEEFDLVSPNSYLRNKESTETMSFQFQDVVAKKIVIILNQKHYVKRELLVEVDDKDLTDAWLNAQGHLELEDDIIFKPVYHDHFAQNPNYFHLNKFLNKRDITEEIEKFHEKYVPIKKQLSKYEYQYGLYNLAVNRNDHYFKGIHVTEPLTTGNIHIASIESVEEHPILPEVNLAVTNIEYYLSDSEDPTNAEWIPVLPKNQKRVQSERLFFDFEYENYNKYVATCLFFPRSVEAVRQNGQELKPHVDYRVSGQQIILERYDASSIYTIDYTPEESAYQIDFLKRYTNTKGVVEPRIAIEEFDRLEKGALITLSKTPFIDKQQLNKQGIDWNPTYLSNAYLPIKVRLVLPDGQQIEQAVHRFEEGVSLTNRTDYFNPNISLLEPFLKDNYQYRVEENQIKFNTELPEGSRVIVEYPYLTGPIRMKIIMRRNLHDVEGLTPFLHEYKVIFQSLQ